MSDMSDQGLIAYCRLHCTTERALFSAQQVNRILALAGHPQGYVTRVDGWISVHEDPMLHLCDLAEARLAEAARQITAGKADAGGE
jgi:hypothetical protein